jgi:hypothetical protein
LFTAVNGEASKFGLPPGSEVFFLGLLSVVGIVFIVPAICSYLLFSALLFLAVLAVYEKFYRRNKFRLTGKAVVVASLSVFFSSFFAFFLSIFLFPEELGKFWIPYLVMIILLALNYGVRRNAKSSKHFEYTAVSQLRSEPKSEDKTKEK